MPKARKSSSSTSKPPGERKLCGCDECLEQHPLGEPKLQSRTTVWRHRIIQMAVEEERRSLENGLPSGRPSGSSTNQNVEPRDASTPADQLQ
jgi:hypothetical protein